MAENFITRPEFEAFIKRYEVSHEKLCKSYRTNLNAQIKGLSDKIDENKVDTDKKIEASSKSSTRTIQWTVAVIGGVLGTFMALLQWYFFLRPAP